MNANVSWLAGILVFNYKPNQIYKYFWVFGDSSTKRELAKQISEKKPILVIATNGRCKKIKFLETKYLKKRIVFYCVYSLEFLSIHDSRIFLNLLFESHYL